MNYIVLLSCDYQVPQSSRTRWREPESSFINLIDVTNTLCQPRNKDVNCGFTCCDNRINICVNHYIINVPLASDLSFGRQDLLLTLTPSTPLGKFLPQKCSLCRALQDMNSYVKIYIIYIYDNKDLFS